MHVLDFLANWTNTLGTGVKIGFTLIFPNKVTPVIHYPCQGKMAVRRLPVPGSDVDSDAESELDTEASQHSDNRSSEHFIDSAIGLSTSDYSTDSLSTFGDKPQASSTPKKQRKLRRDDQYRCPIDVPTEHDQVRSYAATFTMLRESCGLPSLFRIVNPSKFNHFEYWSCL